MRSIAGSNFRDIGEGMVGALNIAAAFLPFARAWYRNWGATEGEVRRSLPGDDLVPRSKDGYTQAITIQASAAQVWPWLVQLGQGRGGFYSYQWLENLAGCQIQNADRIIPEFQHLEVGDKILLHPQGGYPYLVVGDFEPGRSLLLQVRIDIQTGESFELTDAPPEKYVNQSWLLFLDELEDGTTRLISRTRNDWSRGWPNSLVFGIVGPVSSAMDRKMLLGIKGRVEAGVARNAAASLERPSSR